jgi:hypothetical protein
MYRKRQHRSNNTEEHQDYPAAQEILLLWRNHQHQRAHRKKWNSGAVGCGGQLHSTKGLWHCIRQKGIGQEDDAGRIMDKDRQYRLNKAAKQQAYPAAPMMDSISLPPAADRQHAHHCAETPKHAWKSPRSKASSPGERIAAQKCDFCKVERSRAMMNHTEKQQDHSNASMIANTNFLPAADRQACVPLDEGSESRLKHAQIQCELASEQELLRRSGISAPLNGQAR